MGNIADQPTGPDPWPRGGLVAQYKPFIIKRVMPFLYGNPRFDKNVVFAHAIRITWEASQSFKPELGYDFSTYLRHFIPNRLYDAFGPQRLMWGTDWPLVEAHCGYAKALAMVRDEMKFLSEEDKSWMLSRTVERVWKFQ